MTSKVASFLLGAAVLLALNAVAVSANDNTTLSPWPAAWKANGWIKIESLRIGTQKRSILGI
jgi:hypothetical protein